MHRRDLVLQFPATLGALPGLSARYSRTFGLPHEGAARTKSAPPLLPQGERALLRELVRHGAMAASSHNTQPWKFALAEGAIAVLPDLSRRTPVVDPDNHHLFASLGCAAENIAHAALAHGRHADIAIGTDRIEVTLTRTRVARSTLFDAIPSRQCSRTEYDGKSLTVTELRALEEAGRANGVEVIMITGRARMEAVLEYVVRGNEAQIGDAAFVRELGEWIRFNAAAAARTGDGLFSGCMGSPSVPTWLGRRLLPRLLSAKSENAKTMAQIRSSSGLALFVSEKNDPSHWIEAGRAYERFALQATALGIRNAFVNQPVEVPSLRAQLSARLGIDERRPDLLVRFGRGPAMPRSPRRPLEDVLV